MSMVLTDLKGLFKINIKHRHDSFSDQYNRMFMVKILLACTIVMGISWYSDNVNCILPEAQTNSEDFEKFVTSTCWINGLYIYRELRTRHDQVAFYGIPKDINSDGMIKGKDGMKYLCRSKGKTHRIPLATSGECVEMHKTFFLQYQWMPFLIAALALLYYIPYMIHVTVNHDLINLRKHISEDNPDVDKIVKFYFKESKITTKKRRMPITSRQVINIFVKLAYIVVNVGTFYGLNNLLDGEFLGYGNKWIKWTKSPNNIQYDYMGNQTLPRPGDELLPSFGYCELYATSKDIKATFGNYHKLVCEMSQHVLYQYAFILVWFAVIAGIIVSILGLITLSFDHFISLIGIRRIRNEGAGKRLLEDLTYREIEYLEYMKKKNIPVYGEVLEKLRERMLETPSMDDSYDKSDLPSYPMLHKKAPAY